MKPETENEAREIQRADPGARARALWLIAGFLAVAGLPIAFSLLSDGQMTDWAQALAYELVLRPELLFAALFLMVLPLVGVSIYVFVQGTKIVRAERMPYPGQAVIRDTPVVTGRRAVQRGRAMQLIAVFMGLVSLVIPFLPPILLILMNKGS